MKKMILKLSLKRDIFLLYPNEVMKKGLMAIEEKRIKSVDLIRPICITIMYHNLLLFIDIFHI
jgi:hypothetical protein